MSLSGDPPPQTVVVQLGLGGLQVGLSGRGSPAVACSLPALARRALANEAVDAAGLHDELALLLRRALGRAFLCELQHARVLVLEPGVGLPAQLRDALGAVLRTTLGFGGVVMLPACLADVVSTGCFTGVALHVDAAETNLTPVVHGTPLAARAWQLQLPVGVAAVEAAAMLHLLAVVGAAAAGGASAALQPPTMSRREALHRLLEVGAVEAACDVDAPQPPAALGAHQQLLHWARRLLHGGAATTGDGLSAPPPQLVTALAPTLPAGVAAAALQSALSAVAAAECTAATHASNSDGSVGADDCACLSCIAVDAFFAQSPDANTAAAASGRLRSLLSSPGLAAVEAWAASGAPPGGIPSDEAREQTGQLAAACRALLWHSLPDVGCSAGAAVLNALTGCPVDTRRALANSIVLTSAPPLALTPTGARWRGGVAGGVYAHWHRRLAARTLAEARALAASNPAYCGELRPLSGALSVTNTVPPSVATWTGAAALGTLLCDVPQDALAVTRAAEAALDVAAYARVAAAAAPIAAASAPAPAAAPKPASSGAAAKPPAASGFHALKAAIRGSGSGGGAGSAAAAVTATAAAPPPSSDKPQPAAAAAKPPPVPSPPASSGGAGAEAAAPAPAPAASVASRLAAMQQRKLKPGAGK